MIGKLNNSKVFGGSKTKRPSQNRLRSPMPEGGELKVLIKIILDYQITSPAYVNTVG
jgi:hypothetical protein